MGTTAITLEDFKALEVKEEQEESILAFLGIICTFLNLFVVVFVYIYTTLWNQNIKDSLNLPSEKTSTIKEEVSRQEGGLERVGKRKLTWTSFPERGGGNWTHWKRLKMAKPWCQAIAMSRGDNRGLGDMAESGLCGSQRGQSQVDMTKPPSGLIWYTNLSFNSFSWTSGLFESLMDFHFNLMLIRHHCSFAHCSLNGRAFNNLITSRTFEASMETLFATISHQPSGPHIM